MSLRTCTVSYRDPQGITHTVDVQAETLFEAAVLALKAFRSAELFECAPAAVTQLEVAVRPVAVTHTVSVRKLQLWLQSGARGPAEKLAKERLRAAVPWLEE